MQNLKKKIIIGTVVAVLSFVGGYFIKGFMNEGTIYDVGWKSWDITANVLDNGDMEVHEKLVYFNDNYDDYRVSESMISFTKSERSKIDDNDTSRLKENSFYVSVYDEDNQYFINQNAPSSNAKDSFKTDDCLAFSWVEGCKDERGYDVSSNGKYEKVFIYLEDGLKDGLTIEFRYVIEDVITKYEDYSVLNWKFHGAYDYADNKNCTLKINLPDGGQIYNNNIDNESFSKDGMTIMGFGTTNAKLTKQSGNVIEAKAKKLFDSYGDEIEMFVSIPNDKVDLFPEIKSTDSNYRNASGYEKLNKIIVDALEDEDNFYKSYVMIEIAISIVAAILLIINIIVIRHAYIKYDKELKSNFEYEFLREIPNESYTPSIASYLVNEEKLDINSLNAELMDLIRRKFIIVDTNGQDLTAKDANFRFILNQEKRDSSELTSSERYLLNWYFGQIGNGIEFSFDDLDTYMKKASNAQSYNESNTKWNDEVKEEAKKKNWFDQKVKKVSKFVGVGTLTLFAVLACFLVVIAKNLTWLPILFISLVVGSAVTIIAYVPTIKRKTQEGIDEYTRWMAFKNFLKEFSTFEDYPVPSLIIWEHYMVYATMFGIADLVEKQLRTRFKDLQRMEEYDAYPYFRYRVYHHVYYRSNNARNIGMQAIAREQARQGGSGGRSGGFGGGSSFGGGGRGGSFR